MRGLCYFFLGVDDFTRPVNGVGKSVIGTVVESTVPYHVAKVFYRGDNDIILRLNAIKGDITPRMFAV
jgi:hypothetical protein